MSAMTARRFVALCTAAMLLAAWSDILSAAGRGGGGNRGGHGAHGGHRHGGGHGHWHGGSRVFVGVGAYYGGWGYYGYPWWPYYPAYSYPYYYPPAPAVYSPPAYEELPVPAPAPQSYWYYCQDSGQYYPYVKNCASNWVKVPPTPAGG